MILGSALCGVSQGAVVLEHYYSLGETVGLPTDSVGSADFTTTVGTAATINAGGASGSIGSTHYVEYAGGSFSEGADHSALGGGNYAVALWVKTPIILASRTDSLIFQGNTSGGGDLDFILSDGATTPDNDAWAASVSGATWVGPARGVDDSAIADTWTHLGFVHDNGTSSFYINGVSQGSVTNDPTWGLSGLGSTNASITFGIDDLRIYSFANGEGASAITTAMTTVAVPEPSSTALLGLGGLALILRRRK